MKKTYCLFIVACLALFSSCELEHSGNGNLDGMWPLQRIESLSTGEVQDLSTQQLYWNFQVRLLQLDDKNHNATTCLLRFEHANKQLRVYDPYIYNREEGDIPLTDVSLLLPYGIDQLDETFDVVHLSSSHLVLKNGDVQLSLRQY